MFPGIATGGGGLSASSSSAASQSSEKSVWQGGLNVPAPPYFGMPMGTDLNGGIGLSPFLFGGGVLVLAAVAAWLAFRK